MTGARKVRPKPHAADHAHAQLIKGILIERNWTDLDLANALGVGRSTVTCWRRGTRQPHPSWVKLIKALL